MADELNKTKLTEAMKAVFNILANVTAVGSVPASSASSESKDTNNQTTNTAQNMDSIRGENDAATAKKATRSLKMTKEMKHETNKPVFENVEMKRLRMIIEQKKGSQKKNKNKLDATCNPSTSGVITGVEKTIALKPNKSETKIEDTEKPNVMTEKRKRINLKKEPVNKEYNAATSYTFSSTPSTTGRYESTVNTKDTDDNCSDSNTTSDIRVRARSKRRLSNRVELKCPICTYSVVQNAAFLKHLKDNHDVEKIENIGEYRSQECAFCGVMVEKKLYNYHIQTIHTDMFEKKIKL